MHQILLDTEATGKTFNFLSGGYQVVAMPTHNGGTWTLQMRVPGTAPWLDTDLEFTSADAERIWVFAQMEYQLTGGSVGAEAYASAVSYL